MSRILIICAGFISLGLTGCHPYHRNQSHAAVSNASIREGERLAQLYCQGCHLLPEPSQLDSRSWEKGVLPAMGPRLGIFYHHFQAYPSQIRDTNVGRGFYPAQPMMKDEEWQHILDYYTATSPDTLPEQTRTRPVREGLSQFEAVEPAFRYMAPTTTLVRIDTTGERRALLAFDVRRRELYRYSSAMTLEDSAHTSGALVDLCLKKDSFLACNIGVLNPNNGKFGKAQWGRLGADGRLVLDTVPLFDQLARPVQFIPADLNGDGVLDYVVCEFGNMKGDLSWMEGRPGGSFVRHVIRAVPGAIRACVTDLNHDGRPDILALFAQGDEGIFLFTNQGGGKFGQQPVIRFPPMYGSSYFELADFNKDGHADIIYSCGDNADFSPVLKPYHGIYIYENDGHDHFTQRYFFPMHGCYKAMARDFNGDGKLDIAAISFFADYDHQPSEGFVYLQGLGGWDFQPYSLPAARAGKWLTMDVGDLDGDGRPDIVLGNFSFFAPVTKGGVDFSKGPSVLLLRNKGR